MIGFSLLFLCLGTCEISRIPGRWTLLNRCLSKRHRFPTLTQGLRNISPYCFLEKVVPTWPCGFEVVTGATGPFQLDPPAQTPSKPHPPDLIWTSTGSKWGGFRWGSGREGVASAEWPCSSSESLDHNGSETDYAEVYEGCCLTEWRRRYTAPVALQGVATPCRGSFGSFECVAGVSQPHPPQWDLSHPIPDPPVSLVLALGRRGCSACPPPYLGHHRQRNEQPAIEGDSEYP